MSDLTRDTEAIRSDAAGALARARARRSIGTRSAAIKRGHALRRLGQMALAAALIVVAAGITGAIIGGIGFAGVMLTALAIAGAVLVLALLPGVRAPDAAALARTEDVRQLAGRTELWLEAQRPALPPPALTVIDQLGRQLDALAPQLERIEPQAPAAGEIRTLLARHLPEMVEGYRRIPPHLRREERHGTTPEKQLVDGLQTIGREIDSVTRQLAAGDVDRLAIQTRYLETRYPSGATDGQSPHGSE